MVTLHRYAHWFRDAGSGAMATLAAEVLGSAKRSAELSMAYRYRAAGRVLVRSGPPR
jgi:hypothetical protein